MALTENITVLFTDLVGSTELTAALSIDAADELRRQHFALLRQVVASTGGTEVKSLGDGLMVVFNSALAALSCAVAMQQAVQRHGAITGLPLVLRVGVSAGELIRDTNDYFGEPVIEASRLCASATGGQILVADLVRALAGRRCPHTFNFRGALELKGLPEPVVTVEVAWEPLVPPETPGDGVSPTDVPLPPRLEATPPIGVVGRDAEGETLVDAFKRVTVGEGRQIVLIAGEPGIGKTTLATRMARAAFEDGAVVLLGRCDEEVATPYGPFVEALSHYVTHAAEQDLLVHVDTHGAELATLVPVLRQRIQELPAPQSSDPDTERYLLYSAVVGLLSQVARRTPLVVLLDDLQWADKPTLQLLRYVATNTTTERLFVIGAYRHDELSGSHPLTEILAVLRRESGVSYVALSGLDDAGVIAFVEAAAGHDLDESGVDLAQALYRETDGNPFFVWEVLRHLSETGAIYRDHHGRWAASASLDDVSMPDTVRVVIGSRVARLGQTASHVLPLAAVMGREFDLDLLAAVSELEEDDLLDILDAAAAAALVAEVADIPGRFAFSHALIQHTLYRDLGATRRARAHRRIAEAVEAVTGDNPARVGELAYHWCNAPQPACAAKAIDYARRAGDTALTALAPDEAVRHFSQALRLVDLAGGDALLACDLRVGLGQAQRQAGIGTFRETFLDAAQRARTLGATDRLIHAALANTRGWFSASGVVDDDKVAVLEAALEAVPGGDSPERALLLGTLCSELSFGPLDQRLALATEAKDMARRLGDPRTVVQVLSLLDNPLQIPSALDERRANVRQAVALAESLGDPEVLYHALSQCQVNAVQAGDLATAASCLVRLRELSDRLRQPTLTWMTLFKESGMALMSGEPERAEQLAASAVAVGTESGQPDALTVFGSQVMFAHMEQGRLGELVTLVDQAVGDNPGLPAFRAILATAHLDAGNHATALEILERAAADGFASLPLDFVWMIGMTGYALVATELGATGPAAQLYELLTPYSHQIPFIGTLGYFPASWSLGGLATTLGRYDEADTYFTETADLTSRGTMRFYGAANQLAWGRMLVARRGAGDLERARGLLEESKAVAAGRGYAMIGQRADREISRLTAGH